MARNSAKGPTPVDAIKHGDKRTNIPTADAHEFVDPAIEEIRTVRYSRDESLDPQLVWRGKYPPVDSLDGYDNDLVTDAPPIYIQEKIDPRVLIENLRRTAQKPEDEPELALFESFDGLSELDQVDFYKHDANWSNRMILGDGLQVMASLAEREKLRGKVQMVYLDPPYGIKFRSNWQVSARNREVQDGKLPDVSRDAEQIKAFRDTWELGIHSYLTYLRDRLGMARELLTDTGSCFVQIGDENLHLVRSVLDEVFGPENFCSVISFAKTVGATSELLPGTTDFVIWFAKDRRSVTYRQQFVLKIAGGVGATAYTWVELPDGSERRMSADERADPAKLPTGARIFTVGDLTSARVREGRTGFFPIEFEGQEFLPAKREWSTNREGVQRLLLADRIRRSGSGLGMKRYLDDFPAVPLTNLWLDTLGQNQFGGDKTYVVQTALGVVRRCMLMCSDPGDLVLGSHMWFWNHRRGSRAMGQALDHSRYVASGIDARTAAPYGGPFPLVPAC